MKQVFREFFKQQTTRAGILAAVMFQLIFSVVWMTGYDGVTDRAHNLKIAMVNEDTATGSTILQNLQKNLPFLSQVSDSKEAALDQLNRREAQMVLVVPADFTKQLQTPGAKAELQFTLNESNPALIKSIMQGVAGSVTASVNKEAIAAGTQVVLKQANVPEQQAKGMALGLAEKVTSNIQSTNKVDGMANQMIPMMMVLASFVGSMLLSMNLQQSSITIGAAVGKWKQFAARIIISVVSAIIIGAIGSSMVLVLGGHSESGFLAVWAFQTLFLVTFMFFSQVFLLLFGEQGMVFNIISLSLQLVASGAMVPRELLSAFYHGFSVFLPATYAVEGSMNLLFGGPSAFPDVVALILIGAVSLVIAAAAVAVRKQRKSLLEPAVSHPVELASSHGQM